MELCVDTLSLNFCYFSVPHELSDDASIHSKCRPENREEKDVCLLQNHPRMSWGHINKFVIGTERVCISVLTMLGSGSQAGGGSC